MTTTTAVETPAEPRHGRFWEYLTSRQLGRDALYMLVVLPFSIIAFTLWVTGVSVTLSLIVFVIGFPIFVAFAAVNRWWADVQRRWSRLVLGQPIESRYRRLPEGM